MDMLSDFYKETEKSRVWWVDELDEEDKTPMIGIFLFSFDKKKVFNLFRDYPNGLSAEEKAIFDEDEPYWRDFFSGAA